MNKSGLELVKSFEGFSEKPYLCSGGVWTIGYGTTRMSDGTKITQFSPSCTRDEAEEWLLYNISFAEKRVMKYCKVPLNDNQISALTSFVYNVGSGAFKASTLRRRINESDFVDVPRQLARWNKAGGKIVKGLSRRREAESRLWAK
jgi:lysozyme